MLLLAALSLAQAQEVRLCAAEDPAREEALEAWMRLDARHQTGSELTPDALTALLGHPCLALARAEAQVSLAWPDPPTASRWWADGGGRWLRSYLDPADFDLIFLPPDPRAALGPPEGGGPDLLQTLRCPEDDRACGVETAAWTERASEGYAAHAAKAAEDAGCERARAEGYMAWRRCVGLSVGRGDALPVGRIRPPEAGWLVVRGPRGGLTPCESLSAFELSTGAAWTERRCPDRSPERRAGAADVEALQELAWALVLLSELQPDTRVEGAALPLPPGLDRAWSALDAAEPAPESDRWSSAQTYLSWAWTPPEGQGPLVVAGYFAWPWSSSAGEDHVDELLQAVERSLEPGCMPSWPPPDTRAGRCAGEPPGLLLQHVMSVDALSTLPPMCPP